jgi:hypothetical protein
MFLEDDEWVRIAIATLRVLLTRRYLPDDIAALIKGEIEELRGEMRNDSIEAEIAEPTNDLEVASFGLRPVTGDDYA